MKIENRTFEQIKHFGDGGAEFWLARELQAVLQYKEWRNFDKVIATAKIACKISQQDVSHHFVEVNKTIKMPTKPRIGSQGIIRTITRSRQIN